MMGPVECQGAKVACRALVAMSPSRFGKQVTWAGVTHAMVIMVHCAQQLVAVARCSKPVPA
jgi:hypothetical protein